jgi:hypothetical protein
VPDVSGCQPATQRRSGWPDFGSFEDVTSRTPASSFDSRLSLRAQPLDRSQASARSEA